MKKDHLALVGVTALMSLLPLFASAVTVEELTTQIQNLLSQISLLQQQRPPVSTTPSAAANPVSCPSLPRTLSAGSSGGDVYDLQRFLAGGGYFSASPTGFFGPVTQAAVQAWQSANGVVSSGDPASTGWGVVGARTRAAIVAKCATASTPSTPATPAVSTCPIASPPATICSTGWKANTDAY